MSYQTEIDSHQNHHRGETTAAQDIFYFPQMPNSNIFNDRILFENSFNNGDSLSVRSLGYLSPYSRSRPSSPISEREKNAFISPEVWREPFLNRSPNGETYTASTHHSRFLPGQQQGSASKTAPTRCEGSCQTSERGLLLLNSPEFPSILVSSQKKCRLKGKNRDRKHRKSQNNDVGSILEAQIELFEDPQKEENIRSKIAKLRSFWGRSSKLLPSTFKVSFLCPVRRQSEFIDFSLKEILLEEHHQNGPRPKNNNSGIDQKSKASWTTSQADPSAVMRNILD